MPTGVVLRPNPAASNVVDDAIATARLMHAAGVHQIWLGQRVDFDAIEPAIEDPSVDLIALDEALTALEVRDGRKADLVRLRFFAGLSIEQAAEALGVSVATANNDWSYAKSWLRLAMLGEDR